MKWNQIVACIGLIFILFGLSQLYQIKREVKILDKEQNMSEETSNKWVKRVTIIIVCEVIGTILGLIPTIIQTIQTIFK
jgi:TctA family transporter